MYILVIIVAILLGCAIYCVGKAEFYHYDEEKEMQLETNKKSKKLQLYDIKKIS